MTIPEAMILGAVQGLSEFLPISSSGHLLLVQKLLKISGSELFFDTMVHAGTLAAVCVVLWPDIWKLLKRPIQPLTGFLILATLPAVVSALLFRNLIENAFSSTLFLGIAFFFTSAALFTSEYISKRPGLTRLEPGMNWIDAIVIGIMQALALVPGISRSGFTLSGALFRKLDRGFAARFSFLLSIPAILGATVLQIGDLSRGLISAEPLPVVAAGMLTAAVVGFFAIKIMLNMLTKHSLLIFAYYTLVLGIIVLIIF